LNYIQIINMQGKPRILDTLRDFKKISGYGDYFLPEQGTLGIVRDADGNPKGAFDSLCSALQKGELPVPKKVLLPTQKTPRVNILIMPPNNEGTGRILEDLCLAAMIDDPAMTCVDDYFACLAQVGKIQEENDIAEARVHTFLASREEPDKRLGEAAQAGYWDWDSPVFDTVKTFLHQLVE
jgi:hypothetical protein